MKKFAVPVPVTPSSPTSAVASTSSEATICHKPPPIESACEVTELMSAVPRTFSLHFFTSKVISCFQSLSDVEPTIVRCSVPTLVAL